MSSDEIKLRAGRARDLAAVRQFTRRTFSWGDYLPRVWKYWVNGKRGKLFVAEADGRAVGTLHLKFLGEGEAWVEGMRVHPAFRQRGIAHAMDRAAQTLAREQNCNVVRLETSATNYIAQKAMHQFGYCRLVQYFSWEAKAIRQEPANVRSSCAEDYPALATLWSHSQMRRAARGVTPTFTAWRWATLTPTRLQAAIAEGRALVTPANGAPRGLALVRSDDSYDVIALAGDGRTLVNLLMEAKSRAAQHHQRKCYLLMPENARLAACARTAGFTPDADGLLIYQQNL
jgi:ribosomal protein S18 acetylase RimI-like enzyme